MGSLRYVCRTCRVCKKKFETFSDEWGYTLRMKDSDRPMFFCSYSCMRAFEKPMLLHYKNNPRKYKRI